MALSWNEIKDRALHFSKEWEGETRERAEKDSFWNDFFYVFGISRRRVATFEEPVKKLGNSQGFIDLFWKGTLLVEHKSKGKNLYLAFEQATDYFPGIKERDLPKYILVSDFERFRLYDLETKEDHEFNLSEFHENIKLFGFIAGYQKKTYADENPVNIEAAEWMGKLHDELKESGYKGHELEVFLVRLLFCLFADDTSIFEKDLFREFIEERTSEDGSDLGMWLSQLFQILDTPTDKRQTSLDEVMVSFPYVNGQLFMENLRIPSFNTKMRDILLNCSALDWGKISPAIFGSMFQSVMKPDERRNLGAHYTSEKNIQKLIQPLFLDVLKEDLDNIKKLKRGKERRLSEYIDKLCSLKFLDPACGCGNFLIITYRELRLLEIEALKEIYKLQDRQLEMNIDFILKVDVDQFYGIEIDEFPARIAEVALWLMDHQMNMKASEELGGYYARLPLKKAATIINNNALKIEWESIISKDELSYILGNPPFLGHHLQDKNQKEEVNDTLAFINGSGVMDYVSAWFYKASVFIQNTEIDIAFVATNSIVQGEQVCILWKSLLERFHIKINFAHRTFKWSNEAKGNAAVHVVIIGFSTCEKDRKRLFEYDSITGEPHERIVKNINPYLVEAGNQLLSNKTNPICDVPKMKYGSKPTDGGFFILSEEERNEFIIDDPRSEKYIKKYLGAKEYLNGSFRYCLWLVDADPREINQIKKIKNRIEKVKIFREMSKAKTTREYLYHSLFRQITQPKKKYIIIPGHTSERRKYIPFGFIEPDVIISNASFGIECDTNFYFGVLISFMHMTWVKYTCGRIKSDYRYSKDLVYNNFPWPQNPNEKTKKSVEQKAQKVLDVREEFPNSSLADLYDPLTMPPKLVKAHQDLDKAVDLCYRSQAFVSETARIEYLFQLYEQYNEAK